MQAIVVRCEDSNLVSELFQISLVLDLDVTAVKLDEVSVLPEVGHLAQQICAPPLVLVYIASELSDEVSIATVL